MVYIHTIGAIFTWSHIGQGLTTRINAIDGDARAAHDGQAILVDGGWAHHDAACAAQVEVFVQLKVDDIAVAADFDVVLTCGCTDVNSGTWLNLAGGIAIGLDVPTQRGNVLHRVELAAVDGFGRGVVDRTRVHTCEGVATEVDVVTGNHDVFTAFVDGDAAFVDGHQVIGCIT